MQTTVAGEKLLHKYMHMSPSTSMSASVSMYICLLLCLCLYVLNVPVESLFLSFLVLLDNVTRDDI